MLIRFGGQGICCRIQEYIGINDNTFLFINGKGIEPDVEVGFLFRRWIRLESRGEEEDWRQDPQLLRAVELLTEKDGPDADSGD